MRKTSLLSCYTKKELYTELPENEILLSFDNDDDAELFNYWWNKQGIKQFSEYVQKTKY